jgi:hypothetical protein
MIDQDLSGAEPIIDPQDVSSYHFVNAGDPNALHNLKQPLDYRNKTPYGEYQNGRTVYQPPSAAISATTQVYSPDAVHHSYEVLYPQTNPTSINTADGSQTFYAPDMAPITRTASNASEHDSTAEGLSDALGELKIDESGTGMQSIALRPKAKKLTPA